MFDFTIWQWIIFGFVYIAMIALVKSIYADLSFSDTNRLSEKTTTIIGIFWPITFPVFLLIACLSLILFIIGFMLRLMWYIIEPFWRTGKK
jgi:hypothetical protein